MIAPYLPELLPKRRSGTVLAEADPIRLGEAATGEADKIHQQGQSLSVVASWDLHIDDAHRWIPQHIALEGFALDGDATKGTNRPGELAHVPYPWLLLILSADITSGVSSRFWLAARAVSPPTQQNLRA